MLDDTAHPALHLHTQCLQVQADEYCSNFMQLWIELAVLMPTAAASIGVQHIGCYKSVTGVAEFAFAATLSTYVRCYLIFVLYNNGQTLYIAVL